MSCYVCSYFWIL